MAQDKCPHCGGRIKIVLFNDEPYRKPAQRGHAGTFEHTAAPPSGFVSSFWHIVLRGKRYIPPPMKMVVVGRSEIKTSPTQILLNELEIPGDYNDMVQLADIYVRRGLDWSRDNTTQNSTISQHKHNKIKDTFLALRYLEKESEIKYNLTQAGIRFLRHFLR